MKQTQAILIKYLPATTYKGSRISIKDLRFKVNTIISVDYSYNQPHEQVSKWLTDKGYTVHSFSTYGDDKWLLNVTYDADEKGKMRAIK